MFTDLISHFEKLQSLSSEELTSLTLTFDFYFVSEPSHLLDKYLKLRMAGDLSGFTQTRISDSAVAVALCVPPSCSHLSPRRTID